MNQPSARVDLSAATLDEIQKEIDRLCEPLGREGLSLASAVCAGEQLRLATIYVQSLRPIYEEMAEAEKAWKLFGLLAGPAARAQPDESKPVPLSPEALATLTDIANTTFRAVAMLRRLETMISERSEIIGKELGKVFPRE